MSSISFSVLDELKVTVTDEPGGFVLYMNLGAHQYRTSDFRPAGHNVQNARYDVHGWLQYALNPYELKEGESVFSPEIDQWAKDHAIDIEALVSDSDDETDMEDEEPLMVKQCDQYNPVHTPHSWTSRWGGAVWYCYGVDEDETDIDA